VTALELDHPPLPNQTAAGNRKPSGPVGQLCDRTGERGGLPQVLGSCGDCRRRARIVGWLEPLSEAQTEPIIIDSATNLQQQVGAASRPSHLLTFIHSAVHQEIGRSFGDRGANT
jgi:hypothetical protein